jgi:repressor LexA
MGRIAAGVPIAAISEVARHVAVPQGMLSAGSHYALEVRGDSMRDAGINDGDVVVIRETPHGHHRRHRGGPGGRARRRRSSASAARRDDRAGSGNPAYETRLYPDERVKVQAAWLA